jgi:hypothetical protein
VILEDDGRMSLLLHDPDGKAVFLVSAASPV